MVKRVYRSSTHVDLTPEMLARQIVLDGFWMQKHHPDQLVSTQLPIPMAKRCRNRLAKKNGVFLDPAFHSLFDKAIHQIQQAAHESSA